MAREKYADVIECLRGDWSRRFFIAPAEPANPVLKNQLLNDMLLNRAHPFPADMESMLRRIHAHDPALVDNLDHRYFSGWNAGQDLNAGRALLRAIEAYVSTHQATKA